MVNMMIRCIKFFGERKSAPAGANETVNEMNKEANDPLGDASCSASLLLDRCYNWVVDRWKNGFSEEEEKMRNKLREELRAAKEEIRLEKIGKHP